MTPDSREEPQPTHALEAGDGLPENLELRPDFVRAFDCMEDGPPCLFITGRAGTGKSTLLRYFRLNTKRRVVVVAPTGVAAINVGGETIHSFFRFPPRPIASTEIKALKDKRLYRSLDVLVIDEISMVRADMLDGIDQFLRVNRGKKSEPFGGVRVVLIGDPYQLPPVVSSEAEAAYLAAHYKTPYFFSARVLRESGLETVELQHVYRQTDPHFIELLNAIRSGTVTPRVLQELNKRYAPDSLQEDGLPGITLTTTNRQAEHINRQCLEALSGKGRTYEAEMTGKFTEFSERELPTSSALYLKKGTQVMFVKNDPDHRWVNGTLGKVRKLGRNGIKVELGVDGREGVVDVEPVKWELVKYRFDPESNGIEAEVVGTFRQYPLTPAYAITIHKSQGKTFDRVAVDLSGGAFAHGQVYVALSRCRSLEGLTLRTRLRARDVKLDRAVVAFHRHRDLLRPEMLRGS